MIMPNPEHKKFGEAKKFYDTKMKAICVDAFKTYAKDKDTTMAMFHMMSHMHGLYSVLSKQKDNYLELFCESVVDELPQEQQNWINNFLKNYGE